MTDPAASTSLPKPSKRKADHFDLIEPNPSKRTQVPTPINEYEEVCSQGDLVYRIVSANLASRAMLDDKEMDGKDKDSMIKTQAATPMYEDGISSSRFLYIHSIVRHYVSAHKETVEKDKDSVNESPASTTHEEEELSPRSLSGKKDCKHDKEIVGKNKDSANETPTGTTPINEPGEACSKAELVYKILCANIALDCYNKNNESKFELVVDETLDSYLFTDLSGSWIRCHFNAKEYSSINKFYAEIHPSRPAVTTCNILEGETKVGLESCQLIHPVDGYQARSSSSAMPYEDEDSSPELVDKHKDSSSSTSDLFRFSPGFMPCSPLYRGSPGLTLDYEPVSPDYSPTNWPNSPGYGLNSPPSPYYQPYSPQYSQGCEPATTYYPASEIELDCP